LAHFLANDEKYRDLISTMIVDRIWRPKAHPRPATVRQDGRKPFVRRCAAPWGVLTATSSAWSRPLRQCKAAAEKLRRMERKLELRGVGINRSDEGQAARQLLPAGH
jgi:hypothetical protein